MHHKLSVLVVVMVSIMTCQSADNEDALIRRFIWETATRSSDPALASPFTQFTNLLEKQNIKTEAAKPILIEYSQGRNLPKEFGNQVSDFSLQVLVQWGCREILPMLIDRATMKVDAHNENEKNHRNGALSMIMRIGGNEALAIADTVLGDTQKYGSQERFYVYENLAKHLKTLNSSGNNLFKEEIAKLFSDKVKDEADPVCVEVMDRALADFSEEYRKSELRKNTLIKYENTELPYQRKYFRETLDRLNADIKPDTRK